jgi:hypothetical protein
MTACIVAREVLIKTINYYSTTSISLLIILVHMMLRLPTHEVTSEWEQYRVHRSPSDQNSKVETNAGVQVEQYLSASFYDVMEGPCVAEVVEARCCGCVSKYASVR